MALDDYRNKLKLGTTDIVDVIEEGASSASLPNIGASGSAGSSSEQTKTIIHNQKENNYQGVSFIVPYFSVDAKGRVIAKGNSNVNLNISYYGNYYNYYQYYQYSSGD